MASKKLAELLREQHSDPWFEDFLKAFKPGDNAGLLALDEAIQLNQQQHAGAARKRALESALLFQKTNNPAGELRARYEEVYAHQRLQEGETCLEHAALIEPRFRAGRYHELLSRLLVDKAICEKRAGKPGEIDKALKDANQEATDNGFRVIDLRVLGMDAALKKEAGACKLAWDKTVKGLDVYWQGSYPAERLFQLYQALSECSSKQHLWHTAYALRMHAIHIREANNDGSKQDSIALGTLYLDSANILIALKREGPAAEGLSKALLILKNENDPITAKFKAALTVNLAELQLENGNPTLAKTTLEPIAKTVVDSGDSVVAVRVHRLNGAIYQATGDLENAGKAYEAGILRSEQSLATLADSRQRLEWVSALDKLYRGLTEVWIKQNRQQDAWKLWEWYKSRSITQLTKENHRAKSPVTWSELEHDVMNQSYAAQTTPRVVYAVFDDGVQIWTLTGAKLEGNWVAVNGNVVQSKTEALFESASNPLSQISSVWKAGEDLYPILWGPIAGKIPDSGVVVVELDGPVQHLLLETLRSNHRYLFASHQFIYSPGILMDSGLRPSQGISSKSPTFLLDASVSSGESPIASQVREVHTVSQQLSRVDLADGASITLAQVQARLQSNQIFFFAGHGLRDGEDISLVVNPNLLIKASDLAPQNLAHLQLAILAACSTGTSDENGLMDTRSLDNSFLVAGVPRVISSRWDVDSDSTADLMEGIVRNMVHRSPVADSMYSIQQAILEKEQHPYYWAGFYLAGKAN